MEVVDEIVSVDMAVPPDKSETLLLLKDVVNPLGELDLDRDTVPAKPSKLVSVTVEVAELPWAIVTDAGLADMV